jgi:hypothetical protein
MYEKNITNMRKKYKRIIIIVMRWLRRKVREGKRMTFWRRGRLCKEVCTETCRRSRRMRRVSRKRLRRNESADKRKQRRERTRRVEGRTKEVNVDELTETLMMYNISKSYFC